MAGVFNGDSRPPNGETIEAKGMTLDRLMSKDLFDYYRMRQERLLSPKAGGCILMADGQFDEGYAGLFFLIESKFGTGDAFLAQEEEAFDYLSISD